MLYILIQSINGVKNEVPGVNFPRGGVKIKSAGMKPPFTLDNRSLFLPYKPREQHIKNFICHIFSFFLP